MKGLKRSLKTLYDTVMAGTGAVAGANVAHQGIGAMQKEVITLDALTLALVDEATVCAYVGQKILDLAEGLILVHGCVADLTVSKDAAGVSDTFNGDFGIGTVTAGNDATLTSTEQNIVPSTATPAAVAGATTAKGQSTASESGILLDGTTTPVDVFLNFLVDDADQDVTTTPTNLVVSGTITLIYTNLGDV